MLRPVSYQPCCLRLDLCCGHFFAVCRVGRVCLLSGFTVLHCYMHSHLFPRRSSDLNRQLTSDSLQVVLKLCVCTAFVPIVSIAVMLHIPVMMLTRHKQVINCLFLVFIMTGMCSITAILTVDTSDMFFFSGLHRDLYVQHNSSGDNGDSNNSNITKGKEICTRADRSLMIECRSRV